MGRTAFVLVERGGIWVHGSRHRRQLGTPTGIIITTMALNSQNEIGRLSPLTYKSTEDAEESVLCNVRASAEVTEIYSEYSFVHSKGKTPSIC